jgi:hypothetical protein
LLLDRRSCRVEKSREENVVSVTADVALIGGPAPRFTPLSPDPDLQPAVDRFVERLRAGIAARPDLAVRMRAAGTTVCIKPRSGDCGITLLLDRDPPQPRPVAEPAETVIELDRGDFAAVIAGDALLPVVLASRDARCEGQVRRFLAITPVMRTLWHAAGGRL